MKKSNLITVILLIYLGVMAYIGWSKFISAGQYIEYIAIILITLIVIFLLRIVLRKKERLKMERKRQENMTEYKN